MFSIIKYTHLNYARFKIVKYSTAICKHSSKSIFPVMLISLISTICENYEPNTAFPLQKYTYKPCTILCKYLPIRMCATLNITTFPIGFKTICQNSVLSSIHFCWSSWTYLWKRKWKRKQESENMPVSKLFRREQMLAIHQRISLSFFLLNKQMYLNM